MHDLKVWPNVEVDGAVQTTTPGKTPGKEDQMSRLAKVSTSHGKPVHYTAIPASGPFS